MKPTSKVQVRTLFGLVEAPCFYKWKQDVGGVEFEFAVHTASGYAKGFQAPLAISELGTGYDTKAVLLHPNSRNHITTDSVVPMKSRDVKKLARAALHTLLKRVGGIRFLHAMVGAQMQLAKVTMDMDAAEKTHAELKVVMPTKAHCLACEDTKVLTTTDKDHEGQPIEVTCTECIPCSK